LRIFLGFFVNKRAWQIHNYHNKDFRITSEVKSLRIRHLNPEDILDLVEVIKQPSAIQEIIFRADRNTCQNHLQLLLSAIEHHNSHNNNSTIINTMSVVIYDSTFCKDGESGHYLKILANLHSPTQYFKLDITFELCIISTTFAEIAEILQSGTNFNQFAFENTFGEEVDAAEIGPFFEHFIKFNKPLLSLHLQVIFVGNFASMACLAELIQKSPLLTDLTLNTTNLLTQTEYKIIDAITSSNIKQVNITSPNRASEYFMKMIKQSKLEELTLSIPRILAGEALKAALKQTRTLRKFHLPQRLSANQFSQTFNGNESIIDFTCEGAVLAGKNPMHEEADLSGEISKFTQRNKKLQNERVWSIITLLYNIARHRHDNDVSSSSSWNHLPRDVWTIIVSFITFPGVTSLDFGKVARSIFNDQSIRRVI
jgi:hypothetical protein